MKDPGFAEFERKMRAEGLPRVAVETGKMREVVRWGALAVVARSDVLFGMSRMLEVMAEPHFTTTRVFRELVPAQAWLRSQERLS